MTSDPRQFTVRFAQNEADLLAAQRLRYRVFVNELGGDGEDVDHDIGLERDRFDPHCKHLLLIDPARPEGDNAVGVYRLLDRDGADSAGRFYCDSEYDLSPLQNSGRPLLELGRSCLEADHRGGTAMYLLWHALADYISAQGIEILFGVASFHGTDPETLAAPLSWLHHHHLAPEPLRARSRVMQPMDLLPKAELERKAAMLQTPALIKAYLRLGGVVGEGAFVDHEFNTTDICLIVDVTAADSRQSRIYRR